MYYYLLSQVFHWDEKAQKNDPEYPHAKKNILIFMIGSILYFFTAGFLWSKLYSSFIESTLFLSIIRDFFIWFIFLDMFICFIEYKRFWGFSLLSELDGIISTKKDKEIKKLNNLYDIKPIVKEDLVYKKVNEFINNLSNESLNINKESDIVKNIETNTETNTEMNIENNKLDNTQD